MLQILTTFIVDEIATTGLKSILSFVVPGPKSGKVNNLSTTFFFQGIIVVTDSLNCPLLCQIELQYMHDNAGVAAGFGLSTNPIINVSAVLGTRILAIGSDVAFDSASGHFTKYNAGISYNTLDFSTSLTV